jgi:hypothetical protein
MQPSSRSWAALYAALSLLTPSAVLLTTTACLPMPARADDPAASLADEAVTARYTVEKLVYEKQAAERTIKGAENNLQQTAKSLPMLRDTIEKRRKEFDAAREALKTKTTAADAAKQRAAAGGEADRTAAAAAEQARLAADQAMKRAENDLRRDSEQLKRFEERDAKSRADIAAAQESVPRLDREAGAARKTADAMRLQALEADRGRVAGQDPQAAARRIDELIDARLKSLGIPASHQIDDAEFLRRATLDVTGVVPKYEEVIALLDEKSPDKRAAVVNRLLADAGYGRNFAQRFSTVTTEIGTSTLNQARDVFRDWLAESLNLNRRWDRTVREMLASDGRGYQRPAVLFTVAYRMNEQPDPALLLGAAGDHFLGLQIQCAQCHDHPYHEWKLDEFWQMAALFGRVRLTGQNQNPRELDHLVTDDDVDPKEMLRMNGIKYPEQLTGGRIGIPDPVNAGEVLRTVSAKFLDTRSPQLPEKGNHRRAFAEWVTAKENPYFARAAVNRLWSHFFGRGIVEPILNLHPDNEPAHPDVLDLLAEEFRRSDYDLKHLVRVITLTRAYQRSSKPVPGNEKDVALFSRMQVKPLDSYVLLDSRATVLRRPLATGQRRRDEAALFDTRLPGGDPVKYTHGLPQVLKLMNTKDHAEMNGTVQSVTAGKPTPEAIAQLYLAVLGRRPTAIETEEMVGYVEQVGDPRRGLADVFWVLLNSAEFLVNH